MLAAGKYDTVDDLFRSFSYLRGGVDFRLFCHIVFHLMDNRLTLCDIYRLFVASCDERESSASFDDVLDSAWFAKLFDDIAQLKYPEIGEPRSIILDEVYNATTQFTVPDDDLDELFDQRVLELLICHELALQQHFCAYASSDIPFGAGISWQEASNLNRTIKVDEFLTFASSCSIVPSLLSETEIRALAATITARRHPQVFADTDMLFPQFVELICKCASAAASRLAVRARGQGLGSDAPAAAKAVRGSRTTGTGLSSSLDADGETSSVGSDLDDEDTPAVGESKTSSVLNRVGIASSEQPDGSAIGRKARLPLADALRHLFKFMGMEATDRDATVAALTASHVIDGAARAELQSAGAKATDDARDDAKDAKGGGSRRYDGSGGLPGASLSQNVAIQAAQQNAAEEEPSVEDLMRPLENNVPYTAARRIECALQKVAPDALYRTIRAASSVQDFWNTHSRQAMMVRMDFLFSELAQLLPDASLQEERLAQQALVTAEPMASAGKPIVIKDVVQIPAHAPDTVQQMLEAATAHHNANQFASAMKFFDAARFEWEHLTEMKRREIVLIKQREEDMTKQERSVETGRGHLTPTSGSAAAGSGGASSASSVAGTPAGVSGSASTQAMVEEEDDEMAKLRDVLHMSLDQLMTVEDVVYIDHCKANVLHTYGDDESALAVSLKAYGTAMDKRLDDISMILLNGIGVLCYYCLRYDLALQCFRMVAAHREAVFGPRSIDTATAWSNEAASLFCIGRKGAARVRFERVYQVFSDVLGMQHPRTLVVARNLERTRRSRYHVSDDVGTSIQMRSDHSRLIHGSFSVNAVLPPAAAKKKGKKKKKK